MRRPVKTNSNTKSISNVAVKEREELTQTLFRKTQSELVSSLLTELDAKNKAYEFIASRGLISEFKDY